MTGSLFKILVKVAFPVLIGLAVTVWLFNDEFDASSLSEININGHAIAGVVLAVFFVVGRDFGLTWRFHTIARPQLSWGRATRVDLMCAFTSAITPSAVGGSALAIFYLNREGVKLGRAATLTLTTLFLDEMFFVVFCPIIMFVVPFDELFINGGQSGFMEGVKIVFWLVYAGICVYILMLFMGIIAYPRWVSRKIKQLFMWRWLKRWRRGAFEMADNMILTSIELRTRSRMWWLNVFGATTLSWFSRYLVVNALFWGFVPEASPLVVFARQFVVWVVLMVSPTPGGSGISEWLFTGYYGDLIGSTSIALILALTWRLLSYYLYLIVGSVLLPSYFSKKRN